MNVRWTRISGTHFTPARARFFREETRNWYVRIEKPAGTLTVKVYDDETAATTGTAAYAASGSAAVSDANFTLPLTNNAGQAPTFTGASLDLSLDAIASTGTEVWKLDLGKKLERAVLRIMRALAAISQANGYFTTPTVERGVRLWEDVPSYPWVCVVGVGLSSRQAELGSGIMGTSFQSEYTIRILAHDRVDGIDPIEPTALHLFQDIRRAIAAVQVAYDGPVSNLPIFDVVAFEGIENDLAVTWARERSNVEVNLIVSIYEDSAEVTTG